MPREDGTTERKHLEALARLQNKEPPELQAQAPPAVAHLWAAYQELAGGRPAGGFAVSPLSWSDFLAWQTLRAVEFSPWEWKVMRLLDSAVVAELNAAASKRRGK